MRKAFILLLLSRYLKKYDKKILSVNSFISHLRLQYFYSYVVDTAKQLYRYSNPLIIV